MKKIIIADPDVNYVIKLQTKILQKLHGSYEVEGYSEPELFRDVLKKQQEATCLIINENWVSSELGRHDFEFIVALTEMQISIEGCDLSIVKYTNPEDIFNQIRNLVGFSSNTTTKLESAIIMFKSASGGVGKTTLAISLAKYLSQKLYKVFYINTQTIQSFHYYLENKKTIPGNIAVDLQTNAEAALARYIAKEGFYYLMPMDTLLFAFNIEQNIYTTLIQGAKKKGYDFIIIDSDCGIDADSAAQMQIADKIIVVTTPGKNNKFALRQMMKQLNGSSEKIITISNMATAPDAETDEFIEKWYEELDSNTINAFAQSNNIKKLAIAINEDL